MPVVYSETRISPDTRATIAELQLALAQSRHFVRSYEIDPESSASAKALATKTLAEIDKALDGTIHSFTPGASR